MNPAPRQPIASPFDSPTMHNLAFCGMCVWQKKKKKYVRAHIPLKIVAQLCKGKDVAQKGLKWKNVGKLRLAEKRFLSHQAS